MQHFNITQKQEPHFYKPIKAKPCFLLVSIVCK